MTSDLVPAQLRCEYLVDPLGIDADHPRLSWISESTRRDQQQSAYQILVGSSPQSLVAERGDVWDSGKVAGDESAHVAYGGPALRSAQQCWWTVRVWDQDDGVSSYSQPAWWEMGLLRPDDWHGDWIGLDATAMGDAAMGVPDGSAVLPGLHPSPYLRTVLTVAKPIVRARLYITARGLYEARLNGHRVGDALLTPGWTDYHTRIQYQAYDVTTHLRPGENVLGAILGTGWYNGYIGFGQAHACYGAHLALLASLHIEYTDGTMQHVVSDSSWRGAIGPILFSDLLMGETYDARRTLSGWDAPGYDDNWWQRVRVEDRGTALLVADRAEPVKVTEELRPRTITLIATDTCMVDLGQNMVGWVRLRMRGPCGTRVQLRFGEMLNPDGTLYTENLRRARQTDIYILHGDGEEIFEPHFTFHGFRYVEVTGYPGTLTPDAIGGCVVGSATPTAGLFQCSSLLVNQLQRNIVWCQRGNFLSVPTDCPQRDERLGWMGDAQLFARTACFNMDVAAFFTKWLRDVADTQSSAGAFADIAPHIDMRMTTEAGVSDLRSGAPAWGDAGVIVPWTLYQCYGDTQIIEQHYAGMARWLAYIGDGNPDYLRANRRGNDYGDWLALDSGAPSALFESGTPRELLATAFWAYDAWLMARMARAIGRDEDAHAYAALFERIKAAFVAAYIDADGHVAGDTQTGYALALHMDLVPAALRPTVATQLVEAIERNGDHLSTGIVGLAYLCPVLADTGYADVAYRLLTTTTFPSWGYAIEHGATTIWERWDGWTEDRGFQAAHMNSFNHYALGSVGAWLYRYVAGIDVDPEQPGYRHIIIRPHPGGDLTSARAEYRSIRGTIVSAWQTNSEVFQLDITIPANTTATVYLPVSDVVDITEGGESIGDTRGVRFLGVENGWVIVAVASGVYTFRCRTGKRQD